MIAGVTEPKILPSSVALTGTVTVTAFNASANSLADANILATLCSCCLTTSLRTLIAEGVAKIAIPLGIK